MDDADGAAAGDAEREGAGALPHSRPQAVRTSVPATIGGELRAAREQTGLSLEDVADRTKVRPGILADIEADQHDRLPALTYTIGFVKAFARTVGLDPVVAADRYRAESQRTDPLPTMVDMQPLEEKRLPSRRVVVIASALLIFAILGLWAWGAGWLTPPPPAQPAQPATPADVRPLVPEAPIAAPSAAPAADAPVTLTAREEVWVRISDSSTNDSFFMGTMTAGQTLVLPPGKPLVLRTGRAGALQVKVGAEEIPPLGGPAEQVRTLSLAPADLLARPAAGLPPTQPIPAEPGAASASEAPVGPPPSSLDTPPAALPR